MTPCCLARGLLLVTSVTEKDVVAGAMPLRKWSKAVPKVVHLLMIDFKLTTLAQCTNKRPIGTAAPRG